MTELFSPSAPAAPDYRKTLSRVGWGMAVFFAAGQLGQILVAFVLRLLAPDFAATALALFLITDLGLYGIGLPLAFLVVRRLPRCAPPLRDEGGLALTLRTLVMGFCVMYLANFLTLMLMQLVTWLKGASVTNPLQTAASAGNPLLNVLMLCVVPAVCEELVFRAGMYRLTAGLGARVYVAVSAVCFALFHGNLYQIFYAFALGVLLAYLYLRTGKIALCMAVHFCINLMGTVGAMYLASSVAGATLLGLFVLVCIAAGLVLLALEIRRGGFSLPPCALPPHPVRAALFTWGMGAFVLLALLVALLLVLV